MAEVPPYQLDPIGLSVPVTLYDASGNPVVVVAAQTGYLTLAAAAGRIGFFGGTPAAIQTVPLTTPSAQDIIDALLAYGLVLQSD